MGPVRLGSWLPMDVILLGAIVGLAIMAAVVTLVDIRENAGPTWALWLILVVIASDIGGYFFGRIIGGPKILTVISPKKTWSGTIGGWLLAALVGWLMMDALLQGSTLIVLSVFGAMAGQLGDIVESRIKRHAGPCGRKPAARNGPAWAAP